MAWSAAHCYAHARHAAGLTGALRGVDANAVVGDDGRRLRRDAELSIEWERECRAKAASSGRGGGGGREVEREIERVRDRGRDRGRERSREVERGREREKSYVRWRKQDAPPHLLRDVFEDVRERSVLGHLEPVRRRAGLASGNRGSGRTADAEGKAGHAHFVGQLGVGGERNLEADGGL